MEKETGKTLIKSHNAMDPSINSSSQNYSKNLWQGFEQFRTRCYNNIKNCRGSYTCSKPKHEYGYLK